MPIRNYGVLISWNLKSVYSGSVPRPRLVLRPAVAGRPGSAGVRSLWAGRSPGSGHDLGDRTGRPVPAVGLVSRLVQGYPQEPSAARGAKRLAGQ